MIYRCVEIDGVFYESIKRATRERHNAFTTIKERCLSDDFLNYKFVPFRITYTEKRCNVCEKIKPLSEFSKRAASRDGLSYKCKQCTTDYDLVYSQEHSKEANKRASDWRADNPEYHKIYQEEWNKDNLEKIRGYKATWRANNPCSRNKYEKGRRENDIAFRLNGNISAFIRLSLKGKKNGMHWEVLVGYTLEELMAHLESKFTKDMNWDNYGYGKYKWNIDHVIARCHFNITSYECQGFKDCWALKNLQPLWQTRNFEKGDRPMEPKYLIKPF